MQCYSWYLILIVRDPNFSQEIIEVLNKLNLISRLTDRWVQ